LGFDVGSYLQNFHSNRCAASILPSINMFALALLYSASFASASFCVLVANRSCTTDETTSQLLHQWVDPGFYTSCPSRPPIKYLLSCQACWDWLVGYCHEQANTSDRKCSTWVLLISRSMSSSILSATTTGSAKLENAVTRPSCPPRREPMGTHYTLRTFPIISSTVCIHLFLFIEARTIVGAQLRHMRPRPMLPKNPSAPMMMHTWGSWIQSMPDSTHTALAFVNLTRNFGITWW
jgi:hypothetical protein